MYISVHASREGEDTSRLTPTNLTGCVWRIRQVSCFGVDCEVHVLSCQQLGVKLNNLFYTAYNIHQHSQDFWHVYIVLHVPNAPNADKDQYNKSLVVLKHYRCFNVNLV
jgi:hypothetical protein